MTTERSLSGRACGLIACLATATGCGIGIVDNLSGGAEHLPTQGAGPYGKLGLDRDTPADEPFVVQMFPNSVRDPAALWRDDGGFRLWFGYEPNAALGTSEIWYAELADPTELPDVLPTAALVSDAPWEEDWVGAPSVVEVEPDHLVMLYQGGVTTPGIGRADSFDNGRTWTKHTANPLLVDSAQPSAVLLTLEATEALGSKPWLLYATRPGTEGIFRAESDDGEGWSYLTEPVLTSRTGKDDVYDRYAVFNPFVEVRELPSGQQHFGMFFNALASADPDEPTAIGWAGSFDGLDWRRFESPDQPILAPGGAAEYGPSALLEPDRGYLFYNELSRGVQGIAVAVHP